MSLPHPPFELQHASPSQVAKFQACPRAWYIDKVLGIPAPSSEAQQLGTDVHSILERYLKGLLPVGNFPPGAAGEIAKSGIHMLPKPGTVTVEGRVSIVGAPVEYVGVIDYIDEGNNDRIEVCDHKTSAAPKWMRTPEQLKQDVQMVSYAKHAFDLFPQEDAVVIRHHYYGTGNSRWADTVTAEVTRPEVEKVWSGICDTVREMQAVGRKAEPEVEQKLRACSAYGGCFYRSRCFGDGQAVVENTVEDSMEKKTVEDSQMDIFAKLSLARPEGSSVALPAINPPEVHDPILSALSSPREDKKAETTPVLPVERVVLPAGPPAQEIGSEEPVKKRTRRSSPEIFCDQTMARALRITDKSAQALRERKRALGATWPPASTIDWAALLKEHGNPPLDPEWDAAPMALKMAYQVEAFEEAREQLASSSVAVEPAPEPAVSRTVVLPKSVEPETAVGLPSKRADAMRAAAVGKAIARPKYLFVNCFPQKGGLRFLDFSEIVGPIQERVAKEFQMPHVAAVDFSKGYNHVAGQLVRWEWPPDLDAVLIDAMSPWKGCLPVLEDKADIVVRKF